MEAMCDAPRPRDHLHQQVWGLGLALSRSLSFSISFSLSHSLWISRDVRTRIAMSIAV